MQEHSGHIKKMAALETGIQTCFSRVNQTYTAKLINDSSSQYLTQNFEALTEECFAESLVTLDENFKTELLSAQKKLSTLASNVHWFHEDLISSKSTKSIGGVSGGDPDSRFEKIESLKDEILEESENLKQAMNIEFGNLKTLFYVTSTLIGVLILFEFMTKAKRQMANGISEKEAQNELIDNGGAQSVKVGEILKTVLIQNELENCARLFQNYYAYQALKSVEKNPTTFFEAPALLKKKATKEVEVISAFDEEIEEVWNDDAKTFDADHINEEKVLETEIKEMDDLNLDQFTSDTIDLLAEKMFSCGVQITSQVPENLHIEAKREELELILYHAMSFVLQCATKTAADKERAVSINAIKFGNVVAFDLMGTGAAIDFDHVDTDLMICNDLATSISAQVQLENRIDQNAHIIGPRIKVIFKASAHKLIDLKVGTKKEILSQLY